MEPLISVIIPVYNAENSLEKCLDSVLAQTWKNIEVILISDPVTETVENICNTYAERDERIRSIHLTHNHGVSFARNIGIDLARGSFISFVDADDYIEGDMLERLYQNLAKEQADVAICGIERRGFGRYVDSCQDSFACTVSGKEAASCMICRKPFNWTIGGRLFACELVKKIRFAECICCGEDILFQYWLFQHARCVSYVPDKMYHYICREGSTTQRKFDKRQCTESLAYEIIYQDVLERYPELAPRIEQKIMSINVRLAVRAIESEAVRGIQLYRYLKLFHRNLRFYGSREALALFEYKKIAAEAVLLYANAEIFWGLTAIYKGVKNLLKWSHCRQA